MSCKALSFLFLIINASVTFLLRVTEMLYNVCARSLYAEMIPCMYIAYSNRRPLRIYNRGGKGGGGGGGGGRGRHTLSSAYYSVGVPLFGFQP